MSRNAVIGIVIAIIVIVSIFVVLIMARGLRPAERDAGNEPLVSTPKETIDVAQVVSDPVVYDGIVIETEADIVDWLTKKSFYLGQSGGVLGGTSDLLVISDKTFPLPKNARGTGLGLGEETKVKIRGRVQIFNREELERELGIDLESEDLALDDVGASGWDLAPVIIADRIEKI